MQSYEQPPFRRHSFGGGADEEDDSVSAFSYPQFLKDEL